MELTKQEIKQKQDALLKDWRNFWHVSNGGNCITEEIEARYPLQVAGFLRESIELNGFGLTDTSYLRRNKERSDRMMKIKSKYKLDMNDINIMFYAHLD